MFFNKIKSIISIFKKITLNSTAFYSAYSNKYLNCGEISKNMCDQRVVLYGWLHNTRMKGNILLLRDHTGLVQLISNLNNKSFELPPLESVIKVEGHVKQRPEGQINKNMATGGVEILIDKLEVVNEAAKNLPFYIKDYHKSTELLRLKYRYIDLRREDIQDRLRLRSNIEFYFCEFLIKLNNFVNVGTPSLFLSSPGGAREFIVPTKEPRVCYSLIQSPQQHKQLLMVGGLDKYMQLARCYRNEMSRPDRQPEFTQLDIEMSFVNQSHLQSLIEEMLVYSLKNFTELICPFPIITFDNSMRLYGTDRPDLRFDFEIKKYVISDKSVIGIHLQKDDYKSIDLNESSDTVNQRIEIIDCKNCEIYSHQSLESVKKGFILMIPDSGNIQDLEFMGKLRSFIGSYLNSKGKLNYKNKFSFVWINKFPLFEMGEGGVYKSLHHQFTSPIVEHIDFLYSDPTKVIGEQFDLVCNGIEIGGGSIRIHDSKIQEYIIKNILKEDVSCFDHLLSALKSGAPPHGGFALGIDRLISVLTGCNSIRDVIAFPKTADGKDLMSGAPTEITNDQCEYYCLKFSNEFKNESI